jgi:hypothetical protein
VGLGKRYGMAEQKTKQIVLEARVLSHGLRNEIQTTGVSLQRGYLLMR